MKKYNFSRIIISSFLFIIVLLIPFIIFVFLNSSTTVTGIENYDATSPEPKRSNAWYFNPESPQFLTISRLAIISLVVSFGAFGSIVSLLSRRQKEAASIVDASFSELIVIKFIGASFAIILMLFFWGGLISGVLFPRVSFGHYMTIYVHQDLAKLTVWSFIAGFSERLVPQLIENIQKKVTTQSEKQS
jgi:hypothetical protein